jgi:uracil-DNA glycosylase
MNYLKHLPDKSWEFENIQEYKNIENTILAQSGGKQILPLEEKKSGIFYAFELLPLNKVNVLIIGQDPYPNPERAQGLAFSFKNNAPADDSLKNMFIKIDDAYNFSNTNTDLTEWAKQGVLLLNTSLTFTGKDASETVQWRKFWKPYIEYVLQKLINYKKQNNEPLVIMLWGRPANELKIVSYKKDNEYKNTSIKILRSSHPSDNYNAKNTPIFKGSEYEAPSFMDKNHNHFKECNEFLKKHGKQVIDWHT